MTTVTTIVILVLLSIAFATYVEIRNMKVAAFRQSILDKISKHHDKTFNTLRYKAIAGEDGTKEYAEHMEKMWELYDKISYERMVMSTKPLKLEEWYTQEEIELLNSI